MRRPLLLILWPTSVVRTRMLMSNSSSGSHACSTVTSIEPESRTRCSSNWMPRKDPPRCLAGLGGSVLVVLGAALGSSFGGRDLFTGRLSPAMLLLSLLVAAHLGRGRDANRISRQFKG